MSGKINNKILLIVLLGLSGVLVVTKLITSKKFVRTLDTELIKIDTGRISTIRLYPRAESGEEIILSRNGPEWTVGKEDITADADPEFVRNSLNELLNVKTERLVARSEDKWSEYHTTDSLGTRLIIKEGRKTSLDLIIGRFDYQPPPGGYQGYGQNRFTGLTYVRKSGEPEVYAVEGFLAMNFNQGFNAWRNQSLTRLPISLLTKIVFHYPADSGFIAQKSASGRWLVGGQPADSTLMEQYLNGISRKRSSDFDDGFEPSSPPDYELRFEGENMTLLQIRAFSQPGSDVILNSSLNPGAWFRSPRDGVFSELFKRPEDFFKPPDAPAGK